MKNSSPGRFFVLLLFALLISSCANIKSLCPISQQKLNPKDAKNIILIIGDGMGLAQVEASVFSKFGQESDTNNQPMKLSFEKFPVFGYLTTFSANSFVTDSAAAATAFACGKKTNNEMLGVSPTGEKLKNISEIAKEKGKSVGIISSVGLNHATPAGFYAHIDSRGKYDDIIDQFFQSKSVDILIGGGIYRDKWTDERISAKAAENQYSVFTCKNFGELQPDLLKNNKVFGYFDENNNQQIEYEADRKRDCAEPHLSEIAIKSLEILKRNPRGFFLMIESGSIDWASHNNKFEQMVGEVLELDRTVSRTLDYLEKEGLLKKTLIIVTADHDTGGLVIAGPVNKVLEKGRNPEVVWGSKEHTAFPTPVWARGPGSGLLSGKNDNTFIFNLFASTLK